MPSLFKPSLFNSPVLLDTDTAPVSLVSGDFNNDGKADLAVAAATVVDVFLGNGDGTFAPKVPYPRPLLDPAFNDNLGDIRSLQAADCNGDGLRDLVVVSNATVHSYVSVLLAPNFPAAANTVLINPNQPMSSDIGDLNGDGKLDLAVTHDGGFVSVLFGDGRGGFQPNPQVWQVRSAPRGVAIADMDSDGKNDIVVANSGSNNLSILHNDGKEVFSEDGPFPLPVDAAGPMAVAVGLFDDDKALDIAAANNNGPDIGGGTVGNFTVLLRRGIGLAYQYIGFAPTVDVPDIMTSAMGDKIIQLADLNDDKLKDLVAVNDGNTVSVLFAKGRGDKPDGSFQSPVAYTVHNAPRSVTVVDVNDDKHPDLVTAERDNASLTVLLNKGDGTFVQAPTALRANPEPKGLGVGDFNSDNKTDLVVANNGQITLLQGRGNGGFDPAAAFPMILPGDPTAFVGGDLNGDRIPDLVTAHDGGTVGGILNFFLAYVSENQGTTSFSSYTMNPFRRPPRDMFLTDLDGDGDADLVVANAQTVNVLRNNGRGIFDFFVGPPYGDIPAGPEPTAVVAGRFDQDGYADVVVTNPGANRLSFLRGFGDGTFDRPSAIAVPVAAPPTALAVDDVDKDGNLDLIVLFGERAGNSADAVTLLYGDGRGRFVNGPTLVTSRSPNGLGVGDFDMNGIKDIVVANRERGTASVLLGAGNRRFHPHTQYIVGRGPIGAGTDILNRTGTSDVFVVNQVDGTIGTITVLRNKNAGVVPPPDIISVSPTSGSIGTPVTITGSNLAGATRVTFNGVNATIESNTGTQITTRVPNGAQIGKNTIEVTTPGGTDSADFTVTRPEPPTIIDFTPKSGRVGSGPIVIIGTNFINVSAVAFNGVATSDFIVNSPTQITVTRVPAGATTGPIGVATPGGEGSSDPKFFTVLPRPERHFFATAADAGGPEVIVFEALTKSVVYNFFAYDPNFGGGVRVAVGDVNGDGTPDIITAPGPGGGPDIHVYDGNTGQMIRSFFAYDPRFTAGVFVASGDVNADGFADIVCGADAGGGPHVIAFSGLDGTVLDNFFAYHPAFTGGVRVAAGDVDGDGHADIISGPGPGGGPHVSVVSGKNHSLLKSYFAYDPRFTAGIYVAAGDLDADGRVDVITGAGAGGGPSVTAYSYVYDGIFLSFFAFDPRFFGGVRVASVDRNGDGLADILAVPGRGGGANIAAFNGFGQLIDSFFCYNPPYSGGLFVAAR